jgi:hypothetical protein
LIIDSDEVEEEDSGVEDGVWAATVKAIDPLDKITNTTIMSRIKDTDDMIT